MTLSFRTHRSGQTVQTQIRSGSSCLLNSICTILTKYPLGFGLFIGILGRLQQRFLASQNLGTLRYSPNSFRIKVNYQVVDPAVEAAQARLDAMRTGRYVAPKPRQKTVKKKETEEQTVGE